LWMQPMSSWHSLLTHYIDMLTHHESHWVCQMMSIYIHQSVESSRKSTDWCNSRQVHRDPGVTSLWPLYAMYMQCICNVCSRDTWVPCFIFDSSLIHLWFIFDSSLIHLWLIFDSSWLLSDAISISFYISLYQSLSPSTLENSTRYCVPAPSKSKHTRYWPCVDQLDNFRSEHCGLLGFKDSRHQQQNRTRAAHFAASMLESHTAAPQAASVKAGCETLRTWKAAETVPCRCLPSTKAWNGNIMMAYCQPSCSWTALVLLGLGTGSAETQNGRYNPHTQYSCKLHDTFFRSMSIEEPWRT
jgi:hypothetical protein